MIYEYRIYEAVPGKMAALNDRFRSLTLRMFEKHGVSVVGFWLPKGKEEQELHYIVSFRDEEHLKSAWAAFRGDPEWQAGKAASERDGALVSKLTSQVLFATDYSPLQ